MEYICKYCGKTCKNANSLRNHERLCKENPNKQISSFVKFNELKTKGIINVWNKGLTKETDIRVMQYANTLKTKYETNELIPSFKGKHHTIETRKHMSTIAKQNHDNGIGHTWVHRPNNPSYAEQWLYSVLENNNITYSTEVPFFGFFLDVVINNNICIEIDGEQHYDTVRFPKQHETDLRKDKLLSDNGWHELRIRWKYVLQNKQKYEKLIIDFINNIMK